MYNEKIQKICAELPKLVWPFTADHVNAIIGNTGWTECICDICHKDVDVLLQLGEEPDYEARWVDICKGCFEQAGKVLGEA